MRTSRWPTTMMCGRTLAANAGWLRDTQARTATTILRICIGLPLPEGDLVRSSNGGARVLFRLGTAVSNSSNCRQVCESKGFVALAVEAAGGALAPISAEAEPVGRPEA